MLELQQFLLEHENWEELLSQPPYCLKIHHKDGFVQFKYNMIKSDLSLNLVQEARGIIFNEGNKECICYPFKKFFNAGEPDSALDVLDWSTAQVQEKVDGSLITVWNYNDTWHVSTPGNIDAQDAPLDAKFPNFRALFSYALNMLGLNDVGFFARLDKNYTYMFELISPANRVVIKYDEASLVYLGRRNIHTLKEESLAADDKLLLFIRQPKRYALSNYDAVCEAANALPWNQEGYVVCDANYNRVKIKSPAYVMAHYARNNNVITRERLLQVLLAGEEEEFLEYANDYKEPFLTVKTEVQDLILTMEITALSFYPLRTLDRKSFAESIRALPNFLKSYLFACLDGCSLSEYTKDWTAKTYLRYIDELKEKED